MNAEKMTQKTIETLSQAQKLAEDRRHTQVGQLHALYALVNDADDLNAQLLTALGVDLNAFRTALETELGKQASYGGGSGGGLYITQELNSALNRAEDEAKAMGDSYVSVEHVMLGLIERADATLKPLFKRFNIDRAAYLTALKNVRGNTRVNTDNPEGTYDVLNKYGQDLTELAKKQKLDPVIGRDSEIRSVIRILSRKTKNNPCLIGEPGVGKTA
ncbi:MAG: type VI secretion system ATPase TssH, partial [Clostridia bacterium]|nr:type VI secretion system ATPase TssH [Clostridia bacterium]